MDSKVYVICGLPASGKTTLAGDLLTSGLIEHIVDDPKHINEVITAFEIDKNFCITDPYLCHKEHQLKLIELINKYGFDHEFIYFENNTHNCKINADKRVNKKVNNFIDILSEVYYIPDNSNVIKVET